MKERRDPMSEVRKTSSFGFRAVVRLVCPPSLACLMPLSCARKWRIRYRISEFREEISSISIFIDLRKVFIAVLGLVTARVPDAAETLMNNRR